MFRKSRGILWIFLAVLAMTLPTLGVRDILTSHEGRVAQTARQMAEAGWPWNAASVTIPSVGWRTEIDGTKRLLSDPSLPPLTVNPWIVPVINGQARLQKPPLPYWVTAVCFKLFGVNEWAARLVPALLGALLTLIVADLARMLISRRMAIWAAAVWGSSYFIFDEFRKCMVDPYVAFLSIAAVWAGIRGMQNDECRMTNNEKSVSSSFCIYRSSFIIYFYLFLGMGFLAKGPVVFVPAIAGLIPAWMLQRRGGRRMSYRPHLLGVLIFLLIALPWYAIVLHRVPNAWDLWRYESLGGFGEKNEKPQPLWFYLPQLLLIALPWTPVWVAGIVASARGFRRRGGALLWQAIIVLVFSLITQKKNAYLLPATAAQTLLVIQGLRLWFAAARRTGRTNPPGRLIATAAIVFSVAIAVGFPPFAHFSENRRSFSAVGQEMRFRDLIASRYVPIHTESLPSDAAFYLPLKPPADPTFTEWQVVIDDRRNAVNDSSRVFASLFAGRTVIAVHRVELKSSPVDFRWKVFEVRLAPTPSPSWRGPG